MRNSIGASVPDQALAVPVEPASGLAPTGFDPSRKRIAFFVAMPFAAIPILLIWFGFACLSGIDWVRKQIGAYP